MVNAVTVTNYLGESLRLELAHPEKSGIYIKEITGIGPPKADVSVTDIATMDGGFYNSARAEKRNIVMTIGFWDWASFIIEETRHLTYKYFPVKKPLVLVFETDSRKAMISGYVESNEPNIFSKQEEAQISIVCPYPYFTAVDSNENTIEFSSTVSEFEFPFYDPPNPEIPDGFSNEVTDEYYQEHGEYERNIKFSTIVKYSEYNLFYAGDTEVGLMFTIHASGPATNITIYDLKSGYVMKIDTTKLAALRDANGNLIGGIRAQDDIIINTVQGNKYIRLLRNGVYTNILNCLDRNTDWFLLSKGDNLFTYVAESGGDNLMFKAQYSTLYEGI